MYKYLFLFILLFLISETKAQEKITFDIDEQYKKASDHYLAASRYADEAKLYFHIAQNADHYFKDKNIALRYYQKYLKTKDSTFKEYSEQRISQLKEDIHFQTRK